MAQSTFTKSIAWLPPLLILYNFCANLANDIYLPSLPALTHYFEAKSGALQLTMTAWFAGVALPQLFFGPLTDRIGRRPVIIWGGICFVISTLLCALATNVWWLILCRFFQGVGVCSLNVTTFSILIDLYQFRDRIRIMNKISICGTMAPLIGPVLGSYIFTYCGWRANFIVIFIGGLISVAGLWFKLPESNLQLNPKALDFHHVFHNYLFLIRNNKLIKNLIPYCLILSGLVAYLTTAPFIVISTLQVPPAYFGFTQLPIFGIYILGSIYVSYTAEDVLTKNLCTLGIRIILVSSLCLLITSYTIGNNLWFFIIPMIGYALGFSFCATQLINEVMSSAPLSKGSAAAFLGFGMATSCMISSLLSGLLYDGNIASLADLLFVIAIFASAVYLLPAYFYVESREVN